MTDRVENRRQSEAAGRAGVGLAWVIPNSWINYTLFLQLVIHIVRIMNLGLIGKT